MARSGHSWRYSSVLVFAEDRIDNEHRETGHDDNGCEYCESVQIHSPSISNSRDFVEVNVGCVAQLTIPLLVPGPAP